MNFDDAFNLLLDPTHEGAYSNDPQDPGAETMWGVTKRVAVANGYAGEMRAMPRETAKIIYRKRYWDALHLDSAPERAKYTLFDCAVNSGPVQAIKWLQRAIDVVDDGNFGPMTLDGMQKAPGLALAIGIEMHRLDFMTNLPNWPHDSRGWTRRVVSNVLKALV